MRKATPAVCTGLMIPVGAVAAALTPDDQAEPSISSWNRQTGLYLEI